ncbi:MAG: (2Fe-2S)-binding protein [Albidovulum sp.]|nr:(2Fe-2S)-binding protein [Albidovulum sp.]
MENYGPYDPTLDYAPGPATKEIAVESGKVQSWKPLHMSRRNFLRSVVCSGTVIAGSGYLFTTLAPSRADARSVERLVSLNVNGRTRRLDVPPNETLATTLRYRLGLTGTKIGCNQAECGACTVMANGATIYSCSTLTHRVRDKEIVTVEGIASDDGTLHPVQQAFMDEIAPQCGFCTPGQVVAAVALLNINPNPTIEEARMGLSGNVCRCGAYDHYLRGTMKAAERL